MSLLWLVMVGIGHAKGIGCPLNKIENEGNFWVIF
jgi:hypothetical protein